MSEMASNLISLGYEYNSTYLLKGSNTVDLWQGCLLMIGKWFENNCGQKFSWFHYSIDQSRLPRTCKATDQLYHVSSKT